jgi:hypothetical protein
MPSLPPRTPSLARAISEEMGLRWELRAGAAMPDHRPLMYAASEPVTAGCRQHPNQSSRAIHWLEDHGLIWSPGVMPGTGTRTFLPGPRPIGPAPKDGWTVQALDEVPTPRAEPGDVSIETENVIRGVPVEPPVEAPDEAGVAEAPAGGLRGVGTSKSGAVAGHDADDRAPRGDERTGGVA